MVLSKRGDNKILFFVFLFLVLILSVIAIAANETSENQTSEVQDNTSQDILPENQTIEEEINQTIEEEINQTTPDINESLEENITQPGINQTQENLTETNQTNLNETQEPSLIKTILNLIVSKISAIKGEIVNIQAQLSYENDSPVADEQIDFYANETQIGTETTDDLGIVEIDWDTSNIPIGMYIVSANYSGNDVLERSFDSTEVEIIEEIISEPVENITQPEEIILNNITNETLSNEIIINNSINNSQTNQTVINITNETNQVYDPCNQSSPLASTINGISINSPKAKEFIGWFDNFDDAEFKCVEDYDKTNMKIGNSDDNLRYFLINNKKYGIYLFDCNRRTNSCEFIINGVKIDSLYNSQVQDNTKMKRFELDDEFEIKINSIKFDTCGGKRFCDPYYEAYDLVEMEVVKG